MEGLEMEVEKKVDDLIREWYDEVANKHMNRLYYVIIDNQIIIYCTEYQKISLRGDRNSLIAKYEKLLEDLGYDIRLKVSNDYVTRIA